VKLELEWKPSWWMSNLTLYEYKRHVVGLIVRVHSDWSNYNQFRMKAKNASSEARGTDADEKTTRGSMRLHSRSSSSRLRETTIDLVVANGRS
jgi:hypothetical protein